VFLLITTYFSKHTKYWYYFKIYFGIFRVWEIPHNVLALGEEADFEAQNCLSAQT